MISESEISVGESSKPESSDNENSSAASAEKISKTIIMRILLLQNQQMTILTTPRRCSISWDTPTLR